MDTLHHRAVTVVLVGLLVACLAGGASAVYITSGGFAFSVAADTGEAPLGWVYMAWYHMGTGTRVAETFAYQPTTAQLLPLLTTAEVGPGWWAVYMYDYVNGDTDILYFYFLGES